MRMMKKFLKILAIVFFVCVLALAMIPLLFKDMIKQPILDEFAKRTTATLYYAGLYLSFRRRINSSDQSRF